MLAQHRAQHADLVRIVQAVEPWQLVPLVRLLPQALLARHHVHHAPLGFIVWNITELPQLLRARQAHIVQQELAHLHGALLSIIALQQQRILALLEQLLLRIPRV